MSVIGWASAIFSSPTTMSPKVEFTWIVTDCDTGTKMRWIVGFDTSMLRSAAWATGLSGSNAQDKAKAAAASGLRNTRIYANPLPADSECRS
ncbi:hypothetical protein RFM23_28220 [Mesorhizobium abyssinicae]|uniref:DUF1508 domain-containing protein n=1 Tax=Mesorhizobium abyssinicae TaxID=1209958 RepID=A0ABU5AW22_9HYPH|nr:hypothetical protein [Mesorhizobium abyssinicae]MDX8541515.1 hypothetical protein [Mesorhizobium abyssinicae]